MKRNIKLWSNYLIYIGCISLVTMIVFECMAEDNYLNIWVGVGFLVLLIVGHFIFKEDKVLDNFEKPILLESIYGLNTNSIEENGITWEHICQAQYALNEFKERTDFKWSAKNIFDIIVVYFSDDKMKNIEVRVLQNTRELVLEGTLGGNNSKTTIDSMDISNFELKLLSDMHNFTGSKCKINVVRPISNKFLEKYFDKESKELKPIVYNIEHSKGGVQ